MNWKQLLNYYRIEVLRSRDSWIILRLLRCFWSTDSSRQAVLRLRLIQFYRAQGLRRLARYQHLKLVNRYGLYLSSNTEIGIGLHLPHPTSIVIGSGLSIGSHCRLYQQVTLAASPETWSGLMPRVGNHVIIYPGAKFVGNGRVGNNVIVGANAVVTKAFEDNIVLAGVPARIVRYLPPRTANRSE